MEMEWKYIWRDSDITNNGYKFKDLSEYNKFIVEITNCLEIKDGSKILDVGCGDGYVIDFILKYKNIQNAKVYGIDILEKNSNYTSTNCKNYILHDMHDILPFKDKYFDVVICISSIFYLKNNFYLEQLINEINRVSKNTSSIFFGNCMDYDKKSLSLELRQKSHNYIASEHLYVSKHFFINKYTFDNIKIIDNTELNLDFYSGVNYKFNIYVTRDVKNDNLNIGIDFHDTLTYNPYFFKKILTNFEGKIYIITGTPLSQKNKIIEELTKLNFIKNIDYDEIECGYEYEKEDMNFLHFEKMKVHKLELIRKNKISVYFDDNPYYVDYLKDKGICVFQTILSKTYINNFNKEDKHFCSNLQETQFDFINNFKTIKNNNIYIPGAFDLFHIGHLMLLKSIKEKYNGPIIVGLQSDQSIFQQKNKIPILSFNERKEFILNLNLVDKIIEYDNLNQIDILKQQNIKYFAIGPEYGSCNEHIDTLTYCNSNNIIIINTNRHPNISTSDLLNRVFERVKK